jgi:hypothetical protein
MRSRREFLQIGVAALALPISARAAMASEPFAAAGGPTPVPLYKVIFDERFAASRAFGSEAKRLGLPVHAIKGDITDLWFNDLYARWKQSPAAIAGLTAHGAIFCLERLAWDQRMRVVFRADHTNGSGGSIEHALSGPDGMLREAADLSSSGQDWSARIARLVARCPVERPQASKATIVTPMVNPAHRDSEPLISWVIAPVNRT